MLYITNQDKPGMIGQLGQTLGNIDANIATFHLGRKEEGGEAIALLQLDGPLDEDCLKLIQAIPQVNQVKLLSF